MAVIAPATDSLASYAAIRRLSTTTRVMTTAIALETSKGDLPLALALGMVLLAVVLLLHSAMAVLRRGSGRSSALGLA